MQTTATLNALEWHARMTEMAASFYCHWVKTTDPNKLDWSPTVDGNKACRSTLEQSDECASVLLMVSAAIRGETPPTEKLTANNADEACANLMSAVKTYCATVRHTDDSVFDRSFQMPWGPTPGSVLLMLSLSNIAYHGGQVNAIQMATGDMEFHLPG
jgi:hypothetical protein